MKRFVSSIQAFKHSSIQAFKHSSIQGNSTRVRLLVLTNTVLLPLSLIAGTNVVGSKAAYAYACNGNLTCTDQTSTGCDYSVYNPYGVGNIMPGGIMGASTIWLSYSPNCRTDWGETQSPYPPETPTTFTARVDGAGEDTLGLALDYGAYDGSTTTMQVNDAGLCGYTMAWNGSFWVKSSCY